MISGRNKIKKNNKYKNETTIDLETDPNRLPLLSIFSEYIDFEYAIDQIKNSKSKYSFYSWVLFSLQSWSLKYNNWSRSLAY